MKGEAPQPKQLKTTFDLGRVMTWISLGGLLFGLGGSWSLAEARDEATNKRVDDQEKKLQDRRELAQGMGREAEVTFEQLRGKRFSDKDRFVVTCLLAGKSRKEIARVQGVSVSAINQRLKIIEEKLSHGARPWWMD